MSFADWDKTIEGSEVRLFVKGNIYAIPKFFKEDFSFLFVRFNLFLVS